MRRIRRKFSQRTPEQTGIRSPFSETFTGDGSTTEFSPSHHMESLDYVDVGGTTTDATLSGDGMSVVISPPEDGSEIYVSYITGYTVGPVVYRAGNRRWGSGRQGDPY